MIVFFVLADMPVEQRPASVVVSEEGMRHSIPEVERRILAG